MPVVGSRFLIEAGFIIAVAVIAGIERLSTWWIIAVVASAWIIVAIVDAVQQATESARTPPAPTRPAAAPPVSAPPVSAPPVSAPASAKVEETAADEAAPESPGKQEAQSEGSASGESLDEQQP